jgi:hypothetical protein
MYFFRHFLPPSLCSKPPYLRENAILVLCDAILVLSCCHCVVVMLMCSVMLLLRCMTLWRCCVTPLWCCDAMVVLYDAVERGAYSNSPFGTGIIACFPLTTLSTSLPPLVTLTRARLLASAKSSALLHMMRVCKGHRSIVGVREEGEGWCVWVCGHAQ